MNVSNFAISLALWAMFIPKPVHALDLPSLDNPVSFAFPLLGASVTGAVAYLLTNTKGELYRGEDSTSETKVYGKWRTDVPKEEGYSHELISIDSYALIKNGQTDLEKLEKLPYPGVDTIFKAMQYNVKRMP